MTKSVEQKLFEAFSGNHGVRLTIQDVFSLVKDDAVGARITNIAASESGLDLGPCNGDSVSSVAGGMTWREFKQWIKEQNE